MHWIKTIFVASLSAIFVGTVFMALFGGGKVLTPVFREYLLKVETCDYKPGIARAVWPPGSEENPQAIEEIEEPKRTCAVDYNRAKRDIAEGLAMFILALPSALISGIILKRTVNGGSKKK